jgi:hypothetical protein
VQNVNEDRHSEHRSPSAKQAEHEADEQCEHDAECCHALLASAKYAAGHNAIRFRFTPIFIR